MVKIIDLKKEKEELAERLHLSDLLGIIKKELPNYNYNISDQLSLVIFLYKNKFTGELARFALSDSVPCFRVIDNSLENSIIKVAEQYEKIVNKEVIINLDYKQ